MKITRFVVILVAGIAFAADWKDVRHLAPGQKIEVVAEDATATRGTFVSATADALIVRDTSGERSIPRSGIKRVKAYDAGRRIRKGIMWTFIGALAGAGAGIAACPGCGNEGTTSPYIGPGVAAGGAIGALGFLSSPYKTVYKK